MKMRLENLKIQFLHIIYKGPALGPLTKWSIQKTRAKREFFELTISLPRPGPQGPGAKRLFFPRPGLKGPGAGFFQISSFE